MSCVININKAPAGWQDNLDYVYIGRAGHGLSGFFGNPIDHKSKCLMCGVVHGLPGSTLECYERYLVNKLRNDNYFKMRFDMLKGKTLVCFCKPKPCHGDIMLKYLGGNK